MKIGGVNGGSYLLVDDDIPLDEPPPLGTKAVLVDPRRDLVTEPKLLGSILAHTHGYWEEYDGELTADDVLAQAGGEGDTVASLATRYSKGDAVKAPGGRGVVIEVLTELPDEAIPHQHYGEVSEEYPVYRVEQRSSTRLFSCLELHPPD